MSNIKLIALAALAASAFAAPAVAADLTEPQPAVVDAQQQPSYEEPEVGGWYIRGDVDYHWSKFRGANYILYGAPGTEGTFDFGHLKGALSLGGGVGYQINRYLRTDLTADYWFKSKFNGQTSGFCGGGAACTSVDTSGYKAWMLLANAYVDLGTWHGITPYVGAGIGGAHVKWDDLINTDLDGTFTHQGGSGWRFAYAAMAGASYCLTDNAKLDIGYRFSHIEGGRMFGYSTNAGPGYDRGMNVHEIRGGLRYQFGKSDCAPAEQTAYEPAPVYKN